MGRGASTGREAAALRVPRWADERALPPREELHRTAQQLAETLIAHRRRRGWSVDELAERLGDELIGPQELRRIEAGEGMAASEMQALCDVYGVAVDELLRREDLRPQEMIVLRERELQTVRELLEIELMPREDADRDLPDETYRQRLRSDIASLEREIAQMRGRLDAELARDYPSGQTHPQ